jgi:hypothetical protein
MPRARLQPGQNIVDFALQHTGSAMGVIEVARANSVPFIDPYVAPGQLLDLPTGLRNNRRAALDIAAIYSKRQLIPALHEASGYGVNYQKVTPGEPTWVVPGEPTPFTFGNSLAFDGANDYVSSSAPASVFNVGQGDFTWQCWFNRQDTGSNLQTLVSTQDGTPFVGAALFTFDDDTVQLSIEDSSGDSFGGFRSTTQLNDLKWHHVILINRNQNLEMWLDGIQETSFTTNDVVYPVNLTGGVELTLGRREPFGGRNYFSGRLDEVIIQSKAITPSEVTARYNGGQGDAPQDLSNLIVYYRMNQDSGSILPDLSGNNYNGTLKGYTAAELQQGGGAWVPH